MKKIMSIADIKQFFGNVTKNELAIYYGLKSFDCAIPQTVFDKLSVNDFDPWGHYVYCYDPSSFGILFPLTKEGLDHMIKCGFDTVPFIEQYID